MRVSTSQLNVHHSHSDKLNNDIKNQIKIITESYNGKENISELNVQNVADKYGVDSDIARVMINNDIGNYTMVAKLVILQREGVSFSEINKFVINHDDSMEDFVSSLLTSHGFKMKYFSSDFENKMHERHNYISGIKASYRTRFIDLHSFFEKNAPEYKDSLYLSYRYYNHSLALDYELAKLMVLKDNGASKELLDFSYSEKIDYAQVYVALNYEGGQEKIMELSSMLRNLEISEYEFTNRLYKSLGDHEVDDNKQGGDIGQPLLKEAIPRNLYTSELDINFLTNSLSAILDNSELGTTNFSSPYSNSLESLGNMLAVS